MTQPTGTRGYCYIRTSKDVQDKRSQQERCELWLQEHALTPVAWLEDNGARDLSAKRPNFQKLLALIQQGKVDWVLVAERDRLGYRDAWEYGHFIHLFRNHGVQLWTASENKNLVADDRIEPILASLEADKSQHEQRGNSERTLRNRLASIKRGEWCGGKPPYGYDLVAKDRTGVLVWRLVYEPGSYRRVCVYPDGSSKRFDGRNNLPGRDSGVSVYAEKSQDTAILGWVKKIFQWHIQGIGVRAIARMLDEYKVPAIYTDVWLGPTVASILQNPIYADGIPTWNKQGQGRFLEFVGGQQVKVTQVNGKAAVSRRRAESDYVRADALRPDNAIIDRATWEAAQARWRAIRATPKTARRPRSGDNYFTGLLYCADCGKPMSAWGQIEGYRCSTNAQISTRCRCNSTRHDLIEEVVIHHLEKSEKGISWLRDNAEEHAELFLLADESDALAAEFTKEFTRLWRQAKKDGKQPDGKAWDLKSLRRHYGTRQQKKSGQIEKEIKEKERERDRLVKRMGLLDDDAVKVAAARVNELSGELRSLREQLQPEEDRLEAIRATLGVLLEQHRQAREALEQGLPRLKAEAVRRAISKIVVHHEERLHGRQRRSVVVRVEILPHLGPSQAFPGSDLRARG
jgi:DNA invertase Pin-like site-specific DNA recombinase